MTLEGADTSGPAGEIVFGASVEASCQRLLNLCSLKTSSASLYPIVVTTSTLPTSSMPYCEIGGFDTSIDRHAISGGEEWQRRLGNLIREADTVVFVLSRSSAGSDICAWEVEEALRSGKRIIPTVPQPLDGASPPQHLRDLNYIFFYPEPKSPGSGFGSGLTRLVEALNTDLEWLREHTRYLLRATEWDVGGRAENRLLSGNDIAAAKAWAARRPNGAPELTTLQLDFIRTSERASKKKSGDKMLNASALRKLQRRR
jgi:hypothetical protein